MLCDNVDKMNDYNGDSEVNNEILIRDSGQPSLRQSKKSSLTPVTLSHYHHPYPISIIIIPILIIIIIIIIQYHHYHHEAYWASGLVGS